MSNKYAKYREKKTRVLTYNINLYLRIFGRGLEILSEVIFAPEYKCKIFVTIIFFLS